VGDVAVGLEEMLEEADGMAELDPGQEHVKRQREAEAWDFLSGARDSRRSRGRSWGGEGRTHVRRSGPRGELRGDYGAPGFLAGMGGSGHRLMQL
jgi:hypothetical protein